MQANLLKEVSISALGKLEKKIQENYKEVA